jgi:hypothetical protein
MWNSTYLKSHNGRDVFDKARDTEQHGGRVSILLNCPIDLPEGFVSLNTVALASKNTFSDRFRL